MTDKVQLIKEEILRRKQSWQHSDKQYEHGGKDVCDYLLGFIDSLPEESASEDLEEEINKYITGKNPVFENDPIPRNLFNDCIIAAARHFAEWGINHFEDKSEMVSEDLEEAALKYRWEHPFCDGYTTYSFKAGAEWQKRKSMQDFLGKACEWLSKNARNYYSAYATSNKLIEDFKNYMQDEM